jgi:hypothetical protein
MSLAVIAGRVPAMTEKQRYACAHNANLGQP